jgi:5,10-methylenetetrahydromethanopterin reductase
MQIGILAADTVGEQAMGELTDQLRRAADDGFASFWMSNIFGLDALTALAVAGSQVPGIELGTAVVPSYPRHPAVLAQQALTVALATGPGRLSLGIGLSHKIVIEDMYGHSFDKPARHMREYLSVLLPLLDGTPVSVKGDTLSANIGLSTPRAGRVPVLLAALAPRMLDLAGRPRGAPRRVQPAGLRDQRPGRRPGGRGKGVLHLRAAAVLPRHARPGRRGRPGRCRGRR